MDDPLIGAYKDWWETQAAKFPEGKIPAEKAAKLGEAFASLMDITSAEALQCARNSGVLAEQPLDEDEGGVHQEPDEEKAAGSEQRGGTGPMETIVDIVRANEGATREEIEKILRKKNIPFGKNSVSATRSYLKTRGAKTKKGAGGGSRPVPASMPASPAKKAKGGIGAQLDDKIKELEIQVEALTVKLNALKTAKEVLGE
jgi:hypothetical protein